MANSDSPLPFAHVQETPHPFVTAMADFLAESGYRANRPPIANTLMWGSSAKYQEDLKIMNELVDERLCLFPLFTPLCCERGHEFPGCEC